MHKSVTSEAAQGNVPITLKNTKQPLKVVLIIWIFPLFYTLGSLSQ